MTRRTPVTTTLILLWILAYVVTLFVSEGGGGEGPWWTFGRPDGGVLIAAGGLTPTTCSAGEPERIAAHAFLHGFALHLLMNLIVASSLMRQLEQAVGSARTWIVFGAAVLGGAAAHLEWGAGYAVGASSGVFGAAGALTVWAFVTKTEAARSRRVGLVFTLLLFIGISFVPGVAKWGHFGGLAAGTLAFVFLAVLGRGTRPTSARAIRVIAWVLFGLFVVAGVRQVQAAIDAPSASRGRAFLDALSEAERLGHRLYDRPRQAQPQERAELGRRFDALLATPWVEDWDGAEAFRAYAAAWRPVVDGHIPDPHGFEIRRRRALDAWLPYRDRLRRGSIGTRRR